MKDKVRNYEFEKHSSILFILMMIANIINYIFQIVTGRLFDVTIYGELNTLISIFTLVSLPATALNLLVSKYIAEYESAGFRGEAKWLLKKLSILVIFVSFFIFVIGSLCSRIIAQYININDIWMIVLLFAAAAICTLTSIALGGLQGIKHFEDYGKINLIMPAFKLFGSVFLIIIGLNLYGVFFSIALGYAVMLMFGVNILKKYFQKDQIKELNIKIVDVLKFGVGSFIVNAGISFFTNIDVVLVKHYFPSQLTGLYSSAAVLAKMILYVSTSIVVTLFPTVVASKRTNDSGRLLIKSFLYGGGISLITAIGLVILKKPMILFLYGLEYIDAVDYIVLLSLMIVILSLLSIIANFRLAMGHIKSLCLSIIFGVALTIILTIFFHKTIYSIIRIMSFVMLGVTIFNLLCELKYNITKKIYLKK